MNNSIHREALDQVGITSRADVKILREADQALVAEVAKRHGVIEVTVSVPYANPVVWCTSTGS